jgi:G6PDH family F420-dependent oxidoreductase
MELGYLLSSEEHGPRHLVQWAQSAERHGFSSVMVTDHYFPWLDEQGQSPFVWSVMGAIGATTSLRVMTGVTCPTVRIHPAVVAHAAATSAVLMPGRFRLGVGSGENLNEHILGGPWPPVSVRLEMLEEAVAVMRQLWTGKMVTHRGQHYTVDNARLYTLPESPPPVLVSGFGSRSVELAARIGDGYVTVRPDADAISRYRAGGGRGPVIALAKVCYADSAEEARRTAHRLWRTDQLPGQLNQELPLPEHFSQVASLVSEEMVGGSIPCGPHPEPILELFAAYRDAGVDEFFVAQIGTHQEEFLDFAASTLRPRWERLDGDRSSVAQPAASAG